MKKICDFLNKISQENMEENLLEMVRQGLLTFIPSNNMIGPRFLGYDGHNVLLITIVTETTIDSKYAVTPLRSCMEFVIDETSFDDTDIEVSDTYGIVVGDEILPQEEPIDWDSEDIHRFYHQDTNQLYFNLATQCLMSCNIRGNTITKRDRLAEILLNAIPQPDVPGGRKVPEDAELIEMPVITATIKTSRNGDIVNRETTAATSCDSQEAFLQGIVGMEDFKQNIARMEAYVQFTSQVRYSTSRHKPRLDRLPKPSLIYIFLGDSGTGKTTVARQMGRKLKEMGLLSKGHCVEVQRENLVGNCYGDEERLTIQALDESKGGVLFLDEAYRCFKGNKDPKDPGQHILETLMRAFNDDDRCIILAGYRDEMLETLNVNPGFRNRIDDNNIVEFVTPDDDTLMSIAQEYLHTMGMEMDSIAQTELRKFISTNRTQKGRNFGNARFVIKTIDDMIYQHAWNMANTAPSGNPTELYTLHSQDIINREYLSSHKNSRPRIGF